MLENATDNEMYLQNFWTPAEGNCICHNGQEYTIESIVEEIQAICNNTLVWLQDAIWIPSLEDIDNLLTQYGANVIGDTIHVTTHSRKVCYFKRPDSIEEYAQVVRDIRFYTKVHGRKNDKPNNNKIS